MSDTQPDHCFTWRDMEHWVARGLLQTEQLRAIQAYVADGRVAVPASAGIPAPADIRPPVGNRERPAGLNLVSIAYYFGAFIILLAYTLFMGLRWEILGAGGQALIASGTVIGLWAAGMLLRRLGYQLGGNLLTFAGTGVVPLAVYSILRFAGLWPDSIDARADRDFYRMIDGHRLVLEAASAAIALLIAWRTRFPLLTLLVAFWGWYLSMDLTEAMTGRDNRDWGPVEWAVGLIVGLVMLAIGVWQQRRTGSQAWSRWLYLFGHIVVLGNLGALALDAGALLGVLFLAVYLGFVVASVWLQARTFLVFGALGCYAYVSKLAYDVFEGSLGFVFGLALVGLLIVLSAVGYQRFVGPWLAQRLTPTTGAGA